ncbi:glycoside hydrolase family 88 protein [Aaosphaeria arxii CBS 175.79]|uniref:Glycoside hydrolase family 88 protein n=1 Tax=Aaosphaeria arxii CBS 175.79 TaxID=1450172 RepID=A0A6A5Y1V1_9PLEO|nr:glycoside hydrolase family 88 protein [Aaosphaeria arxii CBS 175.79]KAF2018810.1 glycoside hydrolase family 88 protein [Aaosphaeria arxii CBS 175.79]
MSVKGVDLKGIYAENVAAKICQVAHRGLKLQAPLPTYPESVPQTGDHQGQYEHRHADFWTCGFFPGSIYALLERAIKFPQALEVPAECRPAISDHLLKLGRHWSVAINRMSSRTDTHDMGFIVQPALQKDWELTGNPESLQSVVNAAYALASRYDNRVKAIRSWDVAINDRYSLTDMSTNFLVIIDSMCNLDLLYYVGHQQNDPALVQIATTHADTIMEAILRPNYSSYHLVNFDPRTGKPKAKMTNQGFLDESTWSRGQAWSVMGFAQTYTWTKDVKYLQTAIQCADYFLGRLNECKGKHHHPLVPAWDFDAVQENPEEPLRDVSAGVITANGLFIIHQSLQSLPESEVAGLAKSEANYLQIALDIIEETLDMALDKDFASFKPQNATVNGTGAGPAINVNESRFDAILRHSTANHNEHAHKKYWDHGLVYADYFLLEFGNKLLRAGLV